MVRVVGGKPGEGATRVVESTGIRQKRSWKAAKLHHVHWPKVENAFHRHLVKG